MKAVVIHEHGGAEVLKYEDIETPSPGPGEVLIRTRAIGVNHVDIDVRDGISGRPIALPHIIGVDAAGEIAELGAGATQFKVGDRVTPHYYLGCGTCLACLNGQENICQNALVLGGTAWGTYAEFVKVGQHHVFRLPDELSFEDAVSAFVPFATAWDALVKTGRVVAGERVLINAAGSGVGSAAIQVAKFSGAWVIASAGSDEKLDRAGQLGADATVNYRTQDLAEETLKATGGAGVNVALDVVGGEVLRHSIRALAPAGRMLAVGAHAGEQVEIDIIELFRKRNTLYGCGPSTRAIATEVLDLVAAGALSPIIHQRFALKDIAEAHRVLESRDFFGRLVVIP